MVYIQIAIGIVSLLMGLTQLAKEGKPIVQQAVNYSQQQVAQAMATNIERMNLEYHYKGQDNTYQYYSDNTNRYWRRVSRQGVIEYAMNPNTIR